MIDIEVIQNNTPEEALEALKADLAELRQKAKRALEVGDQNNYAIIHKLIDEDLDWIEMLDTEEDWPAKI